MQRSTTIPVLGVAHALDHSFLAALPPILLLIMEDTGATLQTMSLIATVSYLLFGAGALIGGPVSDKIGEGKVLFAGLALAGVSSFVPFVNPGVGALAAGLVMMSAATSFYHPTANSLISKIYRSQTGKAMAAHGVGGSVGQVFIPTISVLLTIAIGWRFSFAFFGVLSIFTAILILRLRPGWTPESAKTKLRMSFLRNRGFWLLVLYSLFIGLYFRGAELFVPTFLTTERSFTIETAGLGISLLMGCGVLGQILGGFSSDRIGAAKALVFQSLGVAASFTFLIAGGTLGAICFLVLYGLSHYATQPTTNVLTANVCTEEERGLVYGIMFFLTFGLGSISSAMAGYLATGPGMTWSFLSLMIMSIIALLVSLPIAAISKGNSPSQNPREK